MKIIADVGAVGAFVACIVFADYAVAWLGGQIERWYQECKRQGRK